MEVYPFAWLFFIPFILIATFTMLNLFIAIIVNTMQTLHESTLQAEEETIKQVVHEEGVVVEDELRALRDEIRSLREALEKR
jgi:voltage-gated sodium channel